LIFSYLIFSRGSCGITNICRVYGLLRRGLNSQDRDQGWTAM
jgi:hypothetical protein